MVDWKFINSSIFEKLAYEYISNKYPELKWESTKLTRDGNRDGESYFVAPIDTTIKYWYEAKYSVSTDKSIPKSHLDSTLVSCMLDGKVVLIAFITNAYISDDYMRRADIFSKQRDNLRIIYVNGEEIENWLYENPSIELKYFFSNSAEYKNLSNQVKNACILQKYDLNGNRFSKTKNLECGKDYVLYISIYSPCIQTASLSTNNKEVILLDSDNRKYDQFDKLKLNYGVNSLYIPLKIIKHPKDIISFNLSCNSEEIPIIVEDICVIDIFNPIIIYKSQIEIQNRLFSLIRDRDISNAVFYISGDPGSGKSYLLSNIYNSSMNPFSSYVINFTGDEKNDAINCFRIIILSLYGDIWNYFDEEQEIVELNEIELLLIQQIKSDRLNLGCIEQVINYYDNNSEYTENNNTQIQIMVDDFHKLSGNNTLLIKSFFNWFIKQRYNCKIFVFSRPDIEFPCLFTKKLRINSLEATDIEATIKANFKNALFLSRIIKKYPIPLNTLHFVNIISQIHNYQDELTNKSSLDVQILLNEIYANSKHLTCISFGNQIVRKYKNNEIVYCIYKITTGISLKALIEFFGDNSSETIYDLCQQRIIKESSDIIFPYHDILVSAYNSIKSKKLDKILETFVLYAEDQNYISKAKMFSVLLGIGKQCFWKYREDARKYRDELHDSAEYYQAIEIANALNECNSKSLNDYDLEDCKNLFVMANCIKYTDSYEKANCEFERIKEIYELTNNPELFGLFLESETEIINNMIWMLDVKAAEEKLKRMANTFENLYFQNQIVGRNLIFAFLNYYNRLMFVNHMLDKPSEADFNNAVNYSIEFNQEQYKAFAKMDYAKSLYSDDLVRAKELVEEALDILISKNEKRRILDARSEKCFICDIIDKTISYNEYSIIKAQMKQNHYIQSVIKIQLKMILLELLYSKYSPDDIRNKLDSIAVNNTTISSGKRHQAFISHLYAATYYKENNLSMSKEYSLKCLKLMENMGWSYRFIHENNSNLNVSDGFVTINEIDKTDELLTQFILDIRIW